MQKLYFEAAWKKTLATNDHEYIKQIFEDVKPNLISGVYFTFLWSAQNHRNDRLITTLIHNVEPKPLELVDTIIAYKQQDKLKSIHKFHVPETIPAYHTMPWTFIFPRAPLELKTPNYVIHEN